MEERAAQVREPEPADRVERLEERVRELADELERVQTRLALLEGRPAPEVEAARAAPAPAEVAEPDEVAPPIEPMPSPSFGDVLPEVAGIGGRTLLILGGGYLLRDLTERGTLSPALGAILGLSYAALWLFVAHRAAREAPSVSAAFYAVSFALTAFPLLGEITVRFEVLSPPSSALAFVTAAGAAIAVAWRRRLALGAWATLVLVVFTLGGSVLQTKQPVPFLLALTAITLGLDWAAAKRSWPVLRVAASALVDLAVLLFTLTELMSEHYTLGATLVQLALFAGTMLFFSVRAQLERRHFVLFERVQAVAVLLVGYLGAVLLCRAAPGAPALALGAASLVMGAIAYAVAYFLFVVPGRDAVEAWFNTSYALAGVLVGSWLVLPEPGFAWAGIGVLFAVLGTRDKHAALPLHAAVCAFSAALGSGLFAVVLDAFWASPRASLRPLDLPSFGALGVALFAYLAPLEPTRARSLWAGSAAKTLALAVSVAGVGALLVALTLGPVGGGTGSGADAGRVAALRTAILAGSALGLSALSRLPRFREAGYLVYPVLGLGALKLLLQDFPNGRALTLFVALALFGAASVLAPRLRYRA